MKTRLTADFDRHLGGWNISAGKWSVRDGKYVSVGSGMCTTGNQEWRDYAVEIRLNTTKPGKKPWSVGALVFRWTERDNDFGGDYYYVLLHSKSNLELGKRVNGRQVKGGLAHVRTVPDGDTWNTIRVELRGGFIRVLINGTVRVEYMDPDPIQSGSIGLMNLGADECVFDDLRVTDVSKDVTRSPTDNWPGTGRALLASSPDLEPVDGTSWPTYRADNRRSGVTSAALSLPLHRQWTHMPRHAPDPAWPEPGKELNRLAFDYTFHTVIRHGMVFFGSSSDCQIHALDLETGTENWHFFTEGPVRFAPVLDGSRLLAASDDGTLYCLSATDGSLLWRYRAAPRDERLLGNGRMISRWPARSGVLVNDGTVYFTAGMWSSDGVYLTALRIEDGSVLWQNDTCGTMYMKMPHDYLEGMAGVSPQGYMLLCGDTLVVPNGRAMPAGFDVKTGRLRFCRNMASKLHHAGGAWNTVTGNLIIGERHPLQKDRHAVPGESDPYPGEGLIGWTGSDGTQIFALAGKHRAVVRDGMIYTSGSGTLTATSVDALMKRSAAYYGSGLVDPLLDRTQAHPMGWWRGTKYPWYPSHVVPVSPYPGEWDIPSKRIYTMILAGECLFAGGRKSVKAIRSKDGKVLWATRVEGQARGLAAVDGRLIVSTTTGAIHCFGSKAGSADISKPVAPDTDPTPMRSRVRAILDQTGVSCGYAIVLGTKQGMLAAELCRQSKLNVYALEPNARIASETRTWLREFGLYGRQATVHTASLKPLPYPDYCANLVVVHKYAEYGDRIDLSELYRVLRPCGGVAWINSPDRMPLKDLLIRSGIPPDEIVRTGEALMIRRGVLPGAGTWTHKYANSSRTASSTDTHVRLPMKMLWYGGPGPARMVSRHWRAPVPLAINGRMFISGEHHVMAVDAYTGREMWSRKLEGIGRFPSRFRGGNIAADRNRVYAVRETQCLALDAASGNTDRIYRLPQDLRNVPVPENPNDLARGGRSKADPVPNERAWEYLAVTDKLLIGSVGVPNFAWSWWPEAFPECPAVFALDKTTGRPVWTYRAENSVGPDSIAADKNTVFLIDRVAKSVTMRARRAGKNPPGGDPQLKALDLRTGTERWSRKISHRPQLLRLGSKVILGSGGGVLSGWDKDGGRRLWQKKIHGARPVILGDRFYAYPHAYNVDSGKRLEITHPLTGDSVPWKTTYKGGCGSFSGCPNALFFRSGSAGMVDLKNDTGIHWLGQVRSSCWISMIPAGGMLLSAEGASNCSCPYNYQTSLAMVPAQRHENWSISPDPGTRPGSRIRKLRMNIGGVGDKRNGNNDLWLAYPRPFRPGALRAPMITQPGIQYQRLNADNTAVARTNTPWLYCSAASGRFNAKLELILQKPARALKCVDVPTMDGLLDDPCWDKSEPLNFSTDRQAVEPDISTWLRYDESNLYIGWRRRLPRTEGEPASWRTETRGDDAPVWQDDSLNIRLRRGEQREGLYLYVSASGATFDGHSNGRIGTNPAWGEEWTHAVNTTAGEWSGEAALPWSTLGKVGITRENLRIYLENTNRTGAGPERTQFKYRPYTRLWCFAHNFADVAFEPARESDVHTYRILFHFAELDANLGPGDRVFDIKLQGKTVITDLDICREAGGTRTAMCRKVENVMARGELAVELVSKTQNPPLLCGIEIIETP